MSIESPAANDTETITRDSRGGHTEKRITSLGRSLRSRMLSLYERSPGVVSAGSIAVLFAAAYLLAPPMGRDYSAQLAHAQLASPIGLHYWTCVGMAGSILSATACCLLR